MSEPTQLEPLWPNERIRARMESLPHVYQMSTIKQHAAFIGQEMRDEYEADRADLLRRIADANERNEIMGKRIAELEAQLASNAAGVERWEPLADGDVLPEKFGKSNFQVSGDGSELTMASEGTVIWADLPPNIRLCRLAASPQPPAMALTDEVYEATRIGLEWLAEDSGELRFQFGDDGRDRIIGAIPLALEWLKQQRPQA